MRTVAIVGVGLIGGSFALALRRAGFTGTIAGVSSPRTVAEAIERGVIDRALPLEEAAATADLLLLAQPIFRILELLPLVGRHLGPQALVTDAGSTKAEIVAAMTAHLPAGQFVGGHPMAGKESRGVASADAGLFQQRTWVLTPTGPFRPDLPQWLERIGAQVVTMSPSEHDRTVAFTSHLPQLVSTALAGTVGAALPGPELAVSGPGLRDMTRLALSPYDVWEDILRTNPGPIDEALGQMIDRLTALRRDLGANAGAFAEGSALRHRLVRSVLLR